VTLSRAVFFARRTEGTRCDRGAGKVPRLFSLLDSKEAYIKANGAGLSLPLDGFDVSLKVGEQNALLATCSDGGEVRLEVLVGTRS
jgi:hypothetical protein